MAKSEYFTNQFSNRRDQWGFLKYFKNTSPIQQIPNNIHFEGKQITSSKKIAIIANNFFIDKIKKIRESFTPSDIDPN